MKMDKATDRIVHLVGDLIYELLRAAGHGVSEAKPTLLGRKSAASYLEMGTTKLDQLVKEGQLPQPIEIGGRPKFVRAELDRHIDRQIEKQRKGTRQASEGGRRRV